MAYIGNIPAEAYTNTVKDSFNGTGSATAFTLSQPTVTNDVRVVVENVVQDPTVAYSVSGTTLTFTSAPPSGTANIYVVHLGAAVMTAIPPSEIADATTFASSVTVQGAFTSLGIDDNANATAITIDSSENVLANTTSTSVIGNGGFAIKPQTGNGTRVDISNAGQAMLLDGAASGPIIGLYGNGTSVGSIGAFGSAGVYMSAPTSGGSALVFNDNAPILYPAKNNSGTIAVADNAIDLGASGVRFKDLYLSGGVFLGGTGSANKLDDVETGTFTPTYSFMTAGNSSAGYSAQHGFYTKIGNLVHFQLDLRISAMTKGTASGDPIVNGLPFTAKSTSGYANSAPVVKLYNHSFSNIPIAGVVYNSTYIALSTMSSNVVSSSLADARGGSIIWISGSYIAA